MRRQTSDSTGYLRHLGDGRGHGWRLLTVALVFSIALALVGQADAPSASAQTRDVTETSSSQVGDVVPGRFAVKLAASPDQAAALQGIAASGFEVVRELRSIGWVVVTDDRRGGVSSLAEAQLALAGSPAVVTVEPVVTYELTGIADLSAPNADRVAAEASNDPLIWLQWGHYSVNATDAWEITQGAGVIVAVIDSGVDLAHEDLAANLLPGFDFFSNDADPSDEHGHGTHVAGTVAAVRNNSFGATGIAPEASILPVRVCGPPGSGCSSDAIAEGIEWAVNSGADVINLSLGGPSPVGVIEEAVAFAISSDVVVVASAGNDGIATPNYPAAHPGVVGVGALTPGGRPGLVLKLRNPRRRRRAGCRSAVDGPHRL